MDGASFLYCCLSVKDKPKHYLSHNFSYKDLTDELSKKSSFHPLSYSVERPPKKGGKSKSVGCVVAKSQNKSEG